MIKLLWKDTKREIIKSKGRFFSIFMIVLIGVAFYAGVSAAPKDMAKSADVYFDETNCMDYRLYATLGFVDDDIEQLKKSSTVEYVDALYSFDALVKVSEEEKVIHLSSVDNKQLTSDNPVYINRLRLVSGRFSQAIDECVIENEKVANLGIKLGDTLTIYSGTDDDLSDKVHRKQFKVVGFVHSPTYLTYEKGNSKLGSGSISVVAYIDQRNFSMDYYTEVLVTIKNSKQLNSFNDSYFDFLKDSKNELVQLGKKQSEKRYDDVIGEATDTLKDAKKELSDKENDYYEAIKEAEDKIRDNEEKIIEAKAKLEVGESAFNEQMKQTKLQLDSVSSQLNDFSNQLNTSKKDVQQQLDANSNHQVLMAQLNEQFKQILQGYNEPYQLIVGNIATLSSSIAQLNAQLVLLNEQLKGANDVEKDVIQQTIEQINQQLVVLSKNYEDLMTNPVKLLVETLNGVIKVNEGSSLLLKMSNSTIEEVFTTMLSKIDMAKQEITKVSSELESKKSETSSDFALKWNEIRSAEKEIAKAKVTLEKKRLEGLEKIDDAKQELRKAEIDIEKIESAKWYVLDRNSHQSYVQYKGATESMAAIAAIFPVFFFLVAALVSLTTMTRLVDEQRNQLATLKALGYDDFHVAFKYIAYAVLASILGSIFGLIIGMNVFPQVIYAAWNLMYALGKMHYEPQVMLMIVASIAAILVTTMSTFIAVKSSLQETSSQLMRPKAPMIGRKILLERIDFIWKRVSFINKVTFRNLFRYKKRMLMTITGIAGCSALLVAGFGIKDSLNDVATLQFEHIFTFDGSVMLNNDCSLDELSLTLSRIKQTENIDDAMLLSNTTAEIEVNNKNKKVRLITVSDTNEFKRFVLLRDRVSQKPLTINQQGVIISEKLSRDYNIKVHDTITLRNDLDASIEIEVVGITENYNNHYVYMSDALYRQEFNLKPANNCVYIKLVEKDSLDATASTIQTISTVKSVGFFAPFISNFRTMIQSLNMVVVVLVFSAAALAFVVLYNLTNVNISERTREIATLKVLGFHNHEVKSYVVKENIILTFLGGVVGLFLGKFLHYFIMNAIDLEDVMFGRVIKWQSYAISLALTVVFALVVNEVMQFTLNKIKMVESLKSVE